MVSREGLTVVCAAVLADVDDVVHAFSTRRAGEDEFDLGPAAVTGEPWAGRRDRFARAAGMGDRPLLAPRQIHGARVVGSGEFAAGAVPEADAVVVRRETSGTAAAAIRTADCLPVLIAARDGTALAAVHAGWRGTAAGVVRRAVEAMRAYGAAPDGLVAALGPAIGPCCYEVGPEVVAAGAEATGGDPAAVSRPGSGMRPHLDLVAANRRQLECAGVAPAAIEAAPWCTRCREDLFWSWRRDGPSAGRMMACIGWRGVTPEAAP